jgi:preprotein translocase subunit SecF
MINIIQKRKYAYAFSIITTVVSIVALVVWGLNTGIDFKGGTLMEVRFALEQVPTAIEIQETLKPIELKSLTVQPTENKGIILRYLASNEEANSKVLQSLTKLDPGITQIRTDFVGGSVSSQITKNAITGTLVSIIVIALFIAYAFRGVRGKVNSYEYGIGAVIALAHDIIITLGVFAFLGHYYGVEVGVPFIAALLTILGYSVNDTIVVYDRIRENLARSSQKEDFETVVNRSLNETLGRSVNTSMTVIITLIAIVLFGGESIKYFGVALLTGVAFGTYSSIFVSSALLVSRYTMKKQAEK